MKCQTPERPVARQRAILAKLAVLVCLAMPLALAACDTAQPENVFLGYVEGDFINVGPDNAGRLETLHVREGETVAKGAALFELESSNETAALAAAQARLDQAKATHNLSVVALERAKRLFDRGVMAQSSLDDAQNAYNTSRAAVAAVEADVASAQTTLDRRTVDAPVAGFVQQVYYRPGEVVAAGRPVVSILPPENLKVRFYVPEAQRARFGPGTKVSVTCDGCEAAVPATVYFLSENAEYSPPVIFSRETRQKLVYMVEARPADEPRILAVGQPVSVRAAEASATVEK